MRDTFDKFVRESGFKILAMVDLTTIQYKVVLYLMNCAVSGLGDLISTIAELASILDVEEAELEKALGDLHMRKLIRLKYNYKSAAGSEKQSLRVILQYDLTRWQLGNEALTSSKDALVYPFRRQEGAALQIVANEKRNNVRSFEEGSEEDLVRTTHRVLEIYLSGRSLDEAELKEAEIAARLLVDTHPVDQILLMLHHFEDRIPTLSLLASSWQHYIEMFEQESQKIDMFEARQKHIEMDNQLRAAVRDWLERRDEHKLDSEEVNVLKILLKHNHPRRQLFWAYQVRTRYPRLHKFFSDNFDVMLPVTNAGSIVRRPDKES